MNLLVSVNKKELDKYLEFTNSFIVGLLNYSVNYFELSIEEIEKLLNEHSNIELFIAINKNIFNDDLLDLEEKLVYLNKIKIKGILFYDLSILSIVKRKKLNIDLIYGQTQMVVNYNIVNFYYDLGCKYSYLSSTITEDEIKEISLKTKSLLMALFIGHVKVSHSKRHLVSNYYKYRDISNYSNINIINEKNKDSKYYLIEDSKGTNILTYDILNGTDSFINLKDFLEYAILDNNLIDDDLFIKILKLYHDNLNSLIDDDDLVKEVKKIIGNYDGFFHKKTIYKVK